MKILIFIFNILGILLTGIFGYIGTIHEFKDRKGRITKWGKMAIYGIPASVIITIISFTLDFIDKNEDDKIVQGGISNIAAEVKRSQNKLETLEISYIKFKIPTQNDSLSWYFRLLDTILNDFPTGLDKYIGINRQSKMWDMNDFEAKGVVREIETGFEITESCPFHPTKFKMMLFPILSIINPQVVVFNKGFDTSKFLPFVDTQENYSNVDLLVPLHNIDSSFTMNISYDAPNKEYYISGQLTSDKNDWIAKSDRIVSSTDLEESKILLLFGPMDLVSNNEYIKSFYFKVRNQFEIEALTIVVNGAKYYFNKDNGS